MKHILARSIGVALFIASNLSAQNFTVLHTLNGNPDGGNPKAGLILVGDTLYGTAFDGGTNFGIVPDGGGTIFSVKTNGSGYSVVYTFKGGTDGAYPRGGVTLLGNTLYGTASQGGGSNNYGTIYSVKTDGTGFTVLHTFTNNDQGNSWSGLTLSGNTLYGTTRYGGTNHEGSIFSISTDGSKYSVLHQFKAVPDGVNPFAGLILSGNTLYGTAYSSDGSGTSGGTVYSMNTDGSGFTVLHTFTGGADGKLPFGGVILSGNTLYGTASGGGTNGNGTIFSVNTDGSGFQVIHTFKFGVDGSNPHAGLILSGNTLYGTARDGGANDGYGNYWGTIFSVNTDGSGFTVQHSFVGTGGVLPESGLLLAGTTLYGTSQGGQGVNPSLNLAYGAVFSITPSAQQPQTITFPAISDRPYGVPPFPLTATASSGLPVSYSLVSGPAKFSNNSVTLTGVGYVTIQASQAGDFTFGHAPNVSQSFTVGKASNPITFVQPSTRTYSTNTNSNTFGLAATAPGGPVTFTSGNTNVIAIAGSTASITGAGTATITANQAGNSNYLAATPVTNSVVISQASQTILFPGLTNETYGSLPVTLPTTDSAGYPITYSVLSGPATLSNNYLSITGIGTVTVTATVPGSTNYSSLSTTNSFTVGKGAQTISFSPTNPITFVPLGHIPFVATAPGGSVTLTSSTPGVITISGTTGVMHSTGSTTLTATQSGNSNYLAAPPVMVVVSVKSPQTITFKQPAVQSYAPNGKFPLVARAPGGPVTFTSSNTNVVAISGSMALIKGAGSAVITANQTGSAKCYAATPVTNTVIVNKATQKITFNPERVISLAKTKSLNLSGVSTSGLPLTFTSSNTNVISISDTTATVTAKGTASLTATQSGSDNYNSAILTKTVIVQ